MTMHIVNPLWTSNGGSERRAVELAGLLALQGPTRLWVDSRADISWIPAGIPVARLRPHLLQFPRDGVLLFVGCYFKPPLWLRVIRPDRIVVLVNTPHSEHLTRFLGRLKALRISTPIELRYAANWLADWVGIPGPVDVSPVNLSKFKPGSGRPEQAPFVIGRLSRNAAYKHHPDDARVYRALAAEGCRVRVMGAPRWLVESLRGVPGIELLGPAKEPAEKFLASLDCFYYRTDPTWAEPSGRVVFEAMASGLPVVCGPGGYREWMQDGKNSFFVDSTDEALAALRALAGDRNLTTNLGQAARHAMEEIFSEDVLRDLTQSLTRGGGGHSPDHILKVLAANGFS